MKISELSTMEIKALIYDSILEKERVVHNIKMLQDELSNRQVLQEEPEEPEKTEDAV